MVVVGLNISTNVCSSWFWHLPFLSSNLKLKHISLVCFDFGCDAAAMCKYAHQNASTKVENCVCVVLHLGYMPCITSVPVFIAANQNFHKLPAQWIMMLFEKKLQTHFPQLLSGPCLLVMFSSCTTVLLPLTHNSSTSGKKCCTYFLTIFITRFTNLPKSLTLQEVAFHVIWGLCF